MRIERVVIRDLRALRHRDDTFAGPDGVFPAACLRGLNGSGKTTYLEAIASLWAWFAESTRIRKPLVPVAGLLNEASLIAVLFSDLPGPAPRLWIVVGNDPSLAPGFGHDAVFLRMADGLAVADPTTLAWWDMAFARAELGAAEVPNVVFIEAENKSVPNLPLEEHRVPPTSPAYLRLVNERGAGHLEHMMRTLVLARPERWKILVGELARLRPHLRLLDRFDERTQRPLFQLPDDTVITVDKLSAGERSVLINLCMVLRWLAPGGVVLLDEPELHQHLSLMRGSIAVTQALIERVFHGQLLVASHAPEVWDHFRMTGALLDLDP